MLVLLPYIISSSAISNTIATLYMLMLSNTLPSKTYAEQYFTALIVLTVLGVGELLGGFITGKIIKTYSNKTCLIYHLSLVTVSSLLQIIFNAIGKFSPLAYIFAFSYGLIDSGVNSHCGMILGFEFGEYTVAAMGIQNITKSLCFAVLSTLSILVVTSKDYIIYFIFWWFFDICSMLLLFYKFPFKTK